MFKKLFGVILVVSFVLVGCKSSDIGDDISKSVSSVFDDTSYVILESNGNMTTIDKEKEVSELKDIIKASKESVSNKTSLEGYFYSLRFCNSDNILMATVNLIKEEFSKDYLVSIGLDGKEERLYYVDGSKLKSVISKYIS